MDCVNLRIVFEDVNNCEENYRLRYLEISMLQGIAAVIGDRINNRFMSSMAGGFHINYCFPKICNPYGFSPICSNRLNTIWRFRCAF